MKNPDDPQLPRAATFYRPNSKRKGRDFYPTIDPDLIRLLIQKVVPMMTPASFWEMAAGQGHLVDPLRQAGYEVFASDLFPGRDDIVLHDFLNPRQPPRCTRGMIALTNPPNNRLTAFLKRCLRLMDIGWLAGFALLTRMGHDTAGHRSTIWNRAAYEWRTCWRPWWEPRHVGEKNPQFTAQWTAWLPGHDGPPRTWRVERSELQHRPPLLFT